ncbi:cation:proton antiporter [Lichenibacterium dinghuense]|uniref:cation:proton antiporter domain-containing protein n=1 Tax=Lichenibacterium dinghuense TaxID=2895977 RepID=UPI002815178E|nr:cation:proton antiporter [Lichenibacterium sp. 6Y81]
MACSPSSSSRARSASTCRSCAKCALPVLALAIVGAGLWGLSLALGHPLPVLWALVFGALISPTDPVAVMGTLKSVDLPESLKVQIEGEALFNHGIGIVLFTGLLRFASGASAGETSPGAVAPLLLREAGGGGLLGCVAGYLASRAMRAIDDYPVAVLVTLALVTAT